MGSAAPAAGAEWIGAVTARGPEARASAAVPADDPFYDPPPGFQHATPGHRAALPRRRAGVSRADPAEVHRHPVAVPDHRHERRPEATVTTVIVPAERGPETVCPMVSYQCAIDAVTSRCFPSYALRRRALAPGALAQFEFLLVAAALAEGWAVSVPDHEGPRGSGARRTSRATAFSTGSAPRSSYERLGLSPDGADRAVGLLRRRPGHRVGRRDERRLCARTQHRGRGARLTGRRPRPHLPPAQRQRLLGPAGDGGRRALTRLSRPGPRHPASTPPTRQGHAAARPRR